MWSQLLKSLCSEGRSLLLLCPCQQTRSSEATSEPFPEKYNKQRCLVIITRQNCRILKTPMNHQNKTHQQLSSTLAVSTKQPNRLYPPTCSESSCHCSFYLSICSMFCSSDIVFSHKHAHCDITTSTCPMLSQVSFSWNATVNVIKAFQENWPQFHWVFQTWVWLSVNGIFG